MNPPSAPPRRGMCLAQPPRLHRPPGAALRRPERGAPAPPDSKCARTAQSWSSALRWETRRRPCPVALECQTNYRVERRPLAADLGGSFKTRPWRTSTEFILHTRLRLAALNGFVHYPGKFADCRNLLRCPDRAGRRAASPAFVCCLAKPCESVIETPMNPEARLAELKLEL